MYLEALCDINLDLLLLCPLEDLAKHDVCNLLDLTLGQLSEDNDLVQPAMHTCHHEPHDKYAAQLPEAGIEMPVVGNSTAYVCQPSMPLQRRNSKAFTGLDQLIPVMSLLLNCDTTDVNKISLVLEPPST